MRLTTIRLFCASLFVLSFGACATRETASTTTATTTATGAQRTQITRDTIPAEGARKIPVTESY